MSEPLSPGEAIVFDHVHGRTERMKADCLQLGVPRLRDDMLLRMLRERDEEILALQTLVIHALSSLDLEAGGEPRSEYLHTNWAPRALQAVPKHAADTFDHLPRGEADHG